MAGGYIEARSNVPLPCRLHPGELIYCTDGRVYRAEVRVKAKP